MNDNNELGALASLVELLQRRAERHPDQRLFSFVSRTGSEIEAVTYGQLHEQAKVIGGHLQTILEPGDRALLLYSHGLEFVRAFFGCLFAGVVAVPAYPPHPTRASLRLRTIISDVQPNVLLMGADTLAPARESLADVAGVQTIPWVATDQIHISAAQRWENPDSARETLAFLQYTSGSTSDPKGVMVSHGNLLKNSSLISEVFRPQSGTWGVSWLPLYHDMGLIGGMLQPLYAGGGTTLMSPLDFMYRPQHWLQLMSQTGAKISGGPNFAYDLCVEKVPPSVRDQLDLSCWEVAFVGAEPICADTLDRFAETFADCGFRREAFMPCYGLAEATLMVSACPRQQQPLILQTRGEDQSNDQVIVATNGEANTRTLVSSGRQQLQHPMVIVNPKTRRTIDENQVGEIWVRGPSICEGYFHAPDLTEAVFRATTADGDGPFLRTGDLGFFRDGELFVTGRLKDVIILRGANYYPQDIERIAGRSHARFRMGGAAAFSVQRFDREHLVLVQEIERHRREFDDDELIDAIRRSVACEFEIDVSAIVLVKTGGVPRTSSGKTRRAACRDDFLTDSLQPLARWTDDSMLQGLPLLAPKNGSSSGSAQSFSPKVIEDYLIVLLSEQLGWSEEDFDIDKPFMDYGVSSSQMVELTGQLELRLGRSLSPTFFFSYPTIATLASFLAQETHSGVIEV